MKQLDSQIEISCCCCSGEVPIYGFNEGAAKVFANNIRDILGDQDENSGKLNLTKKNLNADSLLGMVRFTNWKNLKELYLCYNQIGNKGCC